MNGISSDVAEAGRRMMEMVRDGNVKMHIMSNSSLNRDENVEHKEMIQYSDFIRTKMGYDLLQLNGSDTYE